MELSKEQLGFLRELLDGAEKEQVPAATQQQQQQQQPTNQNLTFTMDGRTYEARDAADLQRLIDEANRQKDAAVQAERARIASLASVEAERINQIQRIAGGQQQADQFSKDRYAELFIQDPIAAYDYLDSHRPSKRQEQAMTQARIQELEQVVAAQTFLAKNPDYVANDQNWSSMTGIMQQYGLPFNANGLGMAYIVGKATGVIQGEKKEEGRQQRASQQQELFDDEDDFPTRRSAPPSVPRNRRGSISESDEQLSRFESLPADQQRKILEGMFMQRQGA